MMKNFLYYRALHQAQTENMYDKLLVFFENEQEKYYQNVKDYILPAMHETDIFVDSSNKEFKNFLVLLILLRVMKSNHKNGI